MNETPQLQWGPDVAVYVAVVDVSRIRADCAEGKHGLVREVQIADLELSENNDADVEKIRRYTTLPAALNAPVLVSDRGANRQLEVVDGYHRVAARMARGLATVTAYVVPATVLRTYSVPEAVAARVWAAAMNEVTRAQLEEDGAAVNRWIRQANEEG